jgi:hypothetical protein
MSIKVKVIKNDLPKLAKELRPRAGRIVRKTAFDIAGGAEERSRVDTGAMKSGFYVVTHGDSTYDQAAAEVRAANPDAEVLPSVERPDDLHALVAAAAAHTIHNELGTASMPAQPMMVPAAEDAQPGYEAAMAKLLED